MARPTLEEEARIIVRNNKILKMDSKGYPREYIAAFWNLSEGQVSKIINKGRQKEIGRNRDKRSVRPIKK